MTESMLAFLGLMIVMLFSMNQQRNSVEIHRELSSIELEVMASAVASESMQLIGSKAFDEATKDNQTVNLNNQNLNALTYGGSFPNGWDCSQNVCDDLDDYNGMVPDTVFFQTGVDENGDEDGFDFLVTAKVTYIDNNGNPTLNQSWVKEVTLFVKQYVADGENKVMTQTIQKKQRFSPSWGD